MKKLKKGRKLSREKDQRNALKRSLLRSLFLNRKIKTTEAKAKEIRPLAEKIITRAKKPSLNSRRYLLRYFSKDLASRIIKEIAPKYENRAGGYTRILKLGPRKSDGAKMAFIELI